MIKNDNAKAVLEDPQVKARICALSILDMVMTKIGVKDQFAPLHDREGDWLAYRTVYEGFTPNYVPRTGEIELTLSQIPVEARSQGKASRESEAETVAALQAELAKFGIESISDAQRELDASGRVIPLKELFIDPDQPEFLDKIKALYEAHRHDQLEQGVQGIDSALREQIVGRVKSRIENAMVRLPKDENGEFLDPDQAKLILKEVADVVNQTAKDNGIALASGRILAA